MTVSQQQASLITVQKADAKKNIPAALIGPTGNKVVFKPWGEKSRQFKILTSTDVPVNTGRSVFNLEHGPSRGDDVRFVFSMLVGREAGIADNADLTKIIYFAAAAKE